MILFLCRPSIDQFYSILSLLSPRRALLVTLLPLLAPTLRDCDALGFLGVLDQALVACCIRPVPDIVLLLYLYTAGHFP